MSTSSTTYILYKKPNGQTGKQTVHFSRFPDGDTHCVVSEPEVLHGCNILIIHSLYPDQNNRIIQLLWLLDTVREYGATKIEVFTPYMPYARQDKRHAPGEAMSAFSLCKVIHDMGCACLYTLDCHFMKGATDTTQNGLRIKSYSMGEQLIAACQGQIGHTDFEIIGPDKGASYLTSSHGSKHMHKTRGEYTPNPEQERYRHVVKMEDSHIELNYKTVLILDDMISTGSTLLKAIDSLHGRGDFTIYVAATHGLFIDDSLTKLTKLTKGIVTSDSIPNPTSISLVDSTLERVVIPDWIT